ncbi:MAG: ATP-binding protein [bacterium]
MGRKREYRSIKTRITSWFILGALVPLIIIIALIYNQRVNSIKKEAFNKLTAIRDLKVEQLNAWLNQKIGDIQSISEDLAVRKILSRAESSEDKSKELVNVKKILHRYLKNYRDYHEIFIMNPTSGVIELSTDKSHEGEDKSEELCFTGPLQSRHIFIKDPCFSQSINGYSMVFSIPVFCLKHNGEHITGILAARVNLKHSLYALLLNRTGMGDTGETLIVNKDTVPLNELRWSTDDPHTLQIKTTAAISASRGETGINEITDYRGEKVLAAYTHIPITKWGFVAKQDINEVYAPIRSLLWNFLILLLISEAIIYGIAIFLGRTIAQPILEMTEVSKRIQNGDLSARNKIQTYDELGYLAESFNNMADSILSQLDIIKKGEDLLRKERDTLEEQVQERTIALKQELNERKRAEEILIESEATARALINAPTDSVFLIDRKGIILDINTTAIRKFNKQSDELIGSCWYDLYSPEVAEDKKERVKTVLQTGTLLRSENKINGIWFDTVIYPITDAWAGIKKLAIIARDISERKRAEEILKRDKEDIENIVHERTNELLRAQKELEKAKRLSDIGTLAATVAHELRNPLAVIGIAAYNIKRKRHNPFVDKHLDNINKKIAEGEQIINNLLSYSRIKMPDYQEIQVYHLLYECINDKNKIFHKKHIQIESKFESIKNIFIEADPFQFKEIINNILDNAYHSCQENKGIIEVRADRSDKKMLRICCKDNGSGIEKNDLSEIFKPFFTRKSKGTGLGLTICHELINNHGGTIGIESEINQGTTVIIDLPTERAL